MKYRPEVRFFIIGFLLIGSMSVSFSQERKEGFGQNRLQHKSFEWYYYSTEKFDIYYYQGGDDFAKLALDYLDEEYNRITDILGYAPFNKTTIFLYNSYTDLQQSNIGIDGDQFTIAGQTNFVKLHTEVAYPGSAEKFKEELSLKLTEVLLNDMMFGGSLAEMFQSAYLLSLPNWFIDGAAHYITYGWNAEMDDYVRDYLDRKNIRKLNRLNESDATFIGQSIWNYIAIKYGKGNLSNILNLTRIIRNEENSIASTLGIRYRTFILEWQNYYLASSQRLQPHYKSPEKENSLIVKRNPEYSFSQIRVNPAGTKVAYAQSYEGKYWIIVEDLESGSKEIIHKGGNRVLTQETNNNIPLIDWMNEQTVGYVYDKGGRFFMGYYDLDTKEKFLKTLNRFTQIHDFSFNDNGKLAILSANTDEKNDLFLVSMRRNAVKRLTNDLFDDVNPRFVPGTDAIVFSSNRNTPMLDEASDISDLKELSTNQSLYIFDLDTTQNELFRLTNNLGKDFYPYPQNNQTIFYLSDQKGIINLYRYQLTDSTFTQVTAFNRSIIEYDLNSINDEFTFLMLDKGLYKVYFDKNFDLRESIFTPQSLRQDIVQAKYLVNRLDERAKIIEQKKDPLLPDSLLAQDDIIDTDLTNAEVDVDTTNNRKYIDADNFEFEEDARFKNESLSFLSSFRNLESEPTVVGPLKYTPRFSMNNIVTSFVIDPIRNFGILLEGEMNDMLENHKFYGGVLFMTDFLNGDVFGEYQYLKHRIDLSVRFDRQVYVFNLLPEATLAQKYILNQLTFGASYPINNALRFSVNPFFLNTGFRNLENNAILNQPQAANFAEDNKIFYSGVAAELVLDNTKIHGLNLYEGTRAKLQFKSFNSISDPGKSFSKLRLDVRNYLRVHREITFATRLNYGKFFGSNRQSFLLGGMMNWPFSDDPVRNELELDRGAVNSNYPFILQNEVDNTNILFTEIAPLRGYSYGELFGTSVLTFSAELRFPVFRYFTKGPIASNFLRNFQAIGFYDIGSSWSGKAPFSRDNSVNTFRVETGTPFDATIKSFRNPWLAGAGFGVRTVMLGYYVRLDWAKPIENFEVGDYRFYLTLGYDF